jgi:hypothetical protein
MGEYDFWTPKFAYFFRAQRAALRERGFTQDKNFRSSAEP